MPIGQIPLIREDTEQTLPYSWVDDSYCLCFSKSPLAFYQHEFGPAICCECGLQLIR